MTVLVVKIILLGTVNALGMWAGAQLFFAHSWAVLAGLAVGLLALNFAVLSRRAYPLRYLLPGLIPFSLMVVYPILANMSLAFTNHGTGHRLTKEQVITHFEHLHYQPEAGERFTYLAFRDPGGEFAFLLTARTTGVTYFAEAGLLKPVDLADPRFIRDGAEIRIEGFQQLSRRELVQAMDQLQQVRLQWGDEQVRLISLAEFGVYRYQYRFDRELGVLLDLRTGTVYTPIRGAFTSAAGEVLRPGFVAIIGVDNFREIFINPHITQPFVRIFSWTLAWAFLSVATTFTLGLTLAIVLNDPYLPLRHLYSTVLIIPYAIPAFISVLIWGGMLNVDFGVVNRILDSLFAIRVPWFHDPMWAKAALLLVNLWLGFPYMMIICMGALQSMPQDLYEAASIDGATRWQQFGQITFPLLLISIAPLLVGSFAFNFNNFTVIFLLTGGGPPIPGAQTPAGATDILISYTYKLAFGGVGAQYGFAAAISLIIFMIIGIISAINFRLTRRLEQVSEGL